MDNSIGSRILFVASGGGVLLPVDGGVVFYQLLQRETARAILALIGGFRLR